MRPLPVGLLLLMRKVRPGIGMVMMFVMLVTLNCHTC